MEALAEEAARLVRSLPEEKARAILEYARYLAVRADEEQWERGLAEPKYAPKVNALIADVEQEIAAGQSEPLDLARL